MPRVPFVAVAINFLSGVLWAARLTFGETPFDASAGALLAADLVLLTSIVTIGSLLRPARWVRNMAAVLGMVWAALATTLPVDQIWIVATTTSVVGLALLWSRPSDPWFRGEIKPDRVPVRATALTLALLAMPGVVAVTGVESVTTGGWILAAVSFGSAWAYARAFPWILWPIRLALPPLGILASFGLLPPGALGLVIFVTAITTLAWTADARLAVQPLLPRRVEAVSILPEMVPNELMESAGFDQRGRPKRDI